MKERESVSETACAKLNICLKVGHRAESGYHFVESVMQTVSLADRIVVEKAADIELKTAGAQLPEDEKNIACLAALRFFEESGVKGGAHIKLEKKIPVSAGLGGGSADAAAVLRALNRLYSRPLTEERLLKTAASLGADVPFCLRGGTAFASGFGEKLRFLPQMRFYYVLAGDKKRLSTKRMYALLDEKGGVGADGTVCLSAFESGERKAAARCAFNSFYALAAESCPRIPERVAFLLQSGAESACITGKGPTVFGIFTEREKALACGAAMEGSVLCESADRIPAELFAQSAPRTE